MIRVRIFEGALQGLPGFSPVGGEGDFGGRTGNWK